MLNLLKSICFCFFALALTRTAVALDNPTEDLERVGVFTQLGAPVDLDLGFIDAQGQPVTLRQVADGKPLIIVPAYYECPRLCGLVLNGTIKLINALTVKLGEQYNVAVVSFDPEEGPELAELRAKQYYSKLTIGLAESELKKSFQFLTGTKASIDALLDQLKFKIVKDHDEFAHTSAIMILTPQGKISQYLSGIEYSSFDARLSLVEASHGSIGNPLDHVFLYCFRFDPKKGKYTWAAFGLMRIAGALTLAFLVFLVIKLSRKYSA